jgi:hypothetical protein
MPSGFSVHGINEFSFEIRVLRFGPMAQLTKTEVQKKLDALLPLRKGIQSLEPGKSAYTPLLFFAPDEEWVEDIGEVGAMNHELGMVFGMHKDGLKIVERGSSLEAVPLLHCCNT